MPSNKSFEFGKYEYSTLGGKYYRAKIGESFAKEISKSTYLKYYSQYHGSTPKGTRTRTNVKLAEGWKKQLWAKSTWSQSPWNNYGRRIQPHLRPLTINDRTPFYGRIQTETGRSHGEWGAKLSNGKYKGAVFVLNGLQEWMKHLQIAKYQMTIQAEHFRITVGQRALRVFQLAFKYHKFYNEDSNWKELASYTRRKRMVAGTWFGSQKSKLYETGAMAGAFDYKPKMGNMTQISTGTPSTTRKRMSVRDVVKGVPLKGRSTYTTNYVYAGIHNEGVPKGRKPGSKVPRRQFMGWSNYHLHHMDKIDTFAYEIADRYLFDSVFLTKKR